ncbi:putative HAF family extracellular repeat protein [Peteryoungia aggregata LMG 23059]|uniref:HAF family extracellular repeat protein n=1 Tax=Peteryoungia aggregata LMG 23059 TaxID=1368425 RepID=A0ABU0GDY2_9HYPH|nr:autotransporter domain-containing protein [Peteryoungia aggregata]MDQ0423129.1 putative HAF family extracellular repeat protein [Peteryoungia aggregata LMG 23059]
MNTTQHSPSLRLRRLALGSVSALTLIMSLGIAGSAQADVVNRDLSVLLYRGYLGNLIGFTVSPSGIGSSNGYSIYPNSNQLSAGPNTITTPTNDLDATAISGDGSTVVGHELINPETRRLFVWTKADGLTYVGTDTVGYTFDLRYVSDDGSALAGTNYDNNPTAFYWHKGDTTITNLGTLGGTQSYAKALSGDGSTVVGDFYDADQLSQAFVWKRDGGGMVGIGVPDTQTQSFATHVSFDGSVVGGEVFNASGPRAFRWTAQTGLTDLGDLGGSETRLQAMNRDGSVLVGYSDDASGSARAFRWANGAIGDLQAPGFINSFARGVSDDGAVVIGNVSMPDPSGAVGPEGPVTLNRGFRWTNESGMITVDQWLRDNGVTLAQDITSEAEAVSADGETVFGRLAASDGYYIAHVGETSGVVDVTDYVTSAAQTNSVAIGLQTSSASTVMFGAQGSPMRNLLDVGRRSVWSTVDTGYDSGTKSEGALALGDFGFGYGLMDGVTVRLQGGVTYTDQDLYDGGDFQARSWYVAPEVTANLLGDLYLTVGGLYGRGELDINRGYLNGSALDYSNGETDTETLAGKMRIDWLNAVSLGDAAFTPYLALSRTLAKTDAYVETGGSFPASHDAVSEHATIARLGVDGVYRLNDTVTLLARAEAAYRFEEQSTGTSTEVAGVQLAVAGEDIKQFWLRGGVGTELAIGGGVASFMLNATTESDDPDIWLRSGWKVDF